jgi:hypothetical protein
MCKNYDKTYEEYDEKTNNYKQIIIGHYKNGKPKYKIKFPVLPILKHRDINYQLGYFRQTLFRLNFEIGSLIYIIYDKNLENIKFIYIGSLNDKYKIYIINNTLFYYYSKITNINPMNLKLYNHYLRFVSENDNIHIYTNDRHITIKITSIIKINLLESENDANYRFKNIKNRIFSDHSITNLKKSKKYKQLKVIGSTINHNTKSYEKFVNNLL